MTRHVCLLVTLILLFAPVLSARINRNGAYVMTAYTTPGTTASAEHAKRRLMAADPSLLPLGTQIRITGKQRVRVRVIKLGEPAK